MRIPAATAVAFALAMPGFAQEGTTLQVNRSEQYGEYLATGQGEPVYLFTADTQGTGEHEPQISCTSEECLDAWPLVTTDAEPRAEEGADASLIGTVEYQGETVVTYNGWPLYTYAPDEPGQAPQGQDIHSFGGEWYLVSPSGEQVHAE